LNPKLSDRVDWAVKRAMSADPDKRPSSCREFLEDLTGQKWQGWTAAPKAEPAPVTQPAAAGDLWYLVYKNNQGQSQKVKGTTDSIRQNVKAQMLGDSGAIMVCRTKHGPFVPLRSAPEFRDLVVNAASVEPGRGSGKFITPTSGGDTARSIQTVPSTHVPRKRDPQADIETAEYRTDEPRIPVKSAKSEKNIDYMPWLIIALAVTAAAVGVIIFAR
jgi:hypothetical protein